MDYYLLRTLYQHTHAMADFFEIFEPVAEQTYLRQCDFSDLDYDQLADSVYFVR